MSTSWFQFDDGGSYVGEVDSVGGTAHGFGIARGRDGSAEYAGSWNAGFEQSGSFKSSSNPDRVYEGQWSEGKRNGLGVERSGGWIYRGEWTDGLKGRYGVRQNSGLSSSSSAKYEGTWGSGLPDGYGVETNADGGTYQGQWSKGLRHGYGIRQSVTYEKAHVTCESFRSRTDASQSRTDASPQSRSTDSRTSPAITVIRNNTDLDFLLRRHDRKLESGGGFVLTEDVAFDGSHRRFGHLLDRLGFRGVGRRRSFSGGIHGQQVGGVLREEGIESRSPQTQSLRVRPSHEALNVVAGTGSRTNKVDDDELSLCDQKLEVVEGGLIERYFGEWKRDRRVGYGVGHRSDGLQYEGEWLNDRKNGYGRTTLPDGSRIEGKYRNNTLVSSANKVVKGPKIFTDAIREKVANAVQEAQRAADNAKQKADIALIRVPSAQVKAEEADVEAKEATRNEENARFQASRTNQPNAKPGNHLTMHRVNEVEFLISYDTGESTTAAGTSKEPTALSSLRLRLPFNKHFKQQQQQHQQQQLQHHHQQQQQQQPGQSFASRKTFLPKRFPWQKSKNTGTTRDERTGFGNREMELVGSHHGDQFHLQQPVEFGMDGGRDFGPGAHHSLSPATGGDLRFDGRMAERVAVPPRPHSTTFGSLGVGVGGGGRGVGEVGRVDRLRKELIEAVEPTDARHPRRNSLPSIVKEKIFESHPHQLTTTTNTAPSQSVAITRPLLTPKSDDPGQQNKTLQQDPPKSIAPYQRRPSHTETYLIDRGVRKRVKSLYEDMENVQRSPSTRQTQRSPSFAKPGAMGKLIMSTMVTGFALSQSTPMRDWTHDSNTFRKMYAFESPTLRRKTKTGSTSDVSSIKPSEVLSREVVYVMSQRKREELIQKRMEEKARRMRGEIVISIYMFQDWRFLLVFFFIIVTAGLVVMSKNSNQN